MRGAGFGVDLALVHAFVLICHRLDHQKPLLGLSFVQDLQKKIKLGDSRLSQEIVCNQVDLLYLQIPNEKQKVVILNQKTSD